MNTWTSNELRRVAEAEELRIASRRQDGTLRKSVTIWVVRVGNDLYVRSYGGQPGAWFRAAQASHRGRIQAGGVEKDVAFVEESDPDLNNQIDVVYRNKYGRYSQYAVSMVTAEVRSTTIKLIPHTTDL